MSNLRLHITPDSRKKLLRFAITLLAVSGILACFYSKPSLAAENTAANPAACQSYAEKFIAAENDCDLERVLSLGDTGQQLGYDCVANMLSKVLANYCSKCLKVKLEQDAEECNLEAIIKEETLINAKMRNQPGYAITRETIKQIKCNKYAENCMEKALKKAVSSDDWNAILKIEDTINSGLLKDCPNFSRFLMQIKEAKGDYFRQVVFKKLEEAIESRDLGGIYRLENFAYNDLQDAVGFPEMIRDFLKIKCQKLDAVLDDILNKAVENCDADKIIEVDELMLYKWRKNCLGYDYTSMEKRILEAKQAYLDRCVTTGLKSCIDRCDLGRILEMGKMVVALHGIASQQEEIAAGKCHELIDCLRGDLNYAVQTCNRDRIQEIEALLNSETFNKCDNYGALLDILKQQQQALTQQCSANSPSPQPSPETGFPPRGEGETTTPRNDISGAVRIVIDKYKSSPSGKPPVEEIDRILCKEFEDNILHPPVLAKNLTSARRKEKFLSIINTALAVQKELPYENYLDRLMSTLAGKIFGIQEYKDKLILSPASQKRLENLFKGMDKELREAVFETHDSQITYTVFTRFYFQLIKIYGFLNNIYEYEGQKPYESFVDRLDEKQRETSCKDLQKLMENADFIGAEDSLSKLLAYYYHASDKNIWESPDIAMSKNINIPVLVNLLQKLADNKDSGKNHNYDAILRILLRHLDDQKYLIKKVEPETQKLAHYDNTAFFNFIYYNLLIPIELSRYPLRSEGGREIPLAELIDEQNKICIRPEVKVTGRERVDGKFRLAFCNKLIYFNPLQSIDSQEIQNTQEQLLTGVLLKKMRQQLADYYEKKVSTAVFLPNTPFNNAGKDSDIDEYNLLKRDLFVGLKKFLEQSQNPEESTNVLRYVLRLSRSYRSGDMQIPFYVVTNDAYRKYFSGLGETEKRDLLIERLKLGLSVKNMIDKDNVKILLNDIKITNEDVIKTYNVQAPNIKTIYEAAAARSTPPVQNEKIDRITDLRENEVLFLLIRNLGNLAEVLKGSREKPVLDLNEARIAYQSISYVLEIYNFYLPVTGNIDPAKVMSNPNALELLVLLSNNRIKQPLAEFNDVYASQDTTLADTTIVHYRDKIAAKMAMHNFLMWEMLFKAIKSNNYNMFNTKADIKYEFINFDLLIPVTEVERINTGNFAEDTFAGFALNPAFLNGADDEIIYQYFFNPASHNVAPGFIPGQTSGGQAPALQPAVQDVSRNQDTVRITCFDDVIREVLMNLQLQNLPPQIKSGFEGFISYQTNNFLQIYSNFASVFNIQKLWELMLSGIDYEASTAGQPFLQKYQDFYLNGNFASEGAKDAGFREDIVNGFSRKFYAGYTGKGNPEVYLSSYYKLCSGSDGGNSGLKGIIDKYKLSDLEFAKVYRKAAVNLMLQVFRGQGLEKGQDYLGQMLYDNQGHKTKPISNTDLYSDNFYRIYEWIWECAYKLADYPELRRIFIEDEVWNRNAESSPQSGSLLSHFKESSKLNLVDKEKANLDKLQRLNAQIKQELAREGKITEALNRICQGEIEKEVQASFMTVMTLRKTHNDLLLKHMRQKTFKDEDERRQMQRAYQTLALSLSPDEIQKLPYIYPIIMPLANYAQPGCVKINDVDRIWFENERNFKYCFLYLYRKQADLGRTHRNYNSLCSKMGISDKDGLVALTKFFNRDLNFEFFDQNFDSGTFNKESKFFGFEGYTFKYIKTESQNSIPQSVLTNIFRTYCIYSQYCRACDLVEFYNKRKVGMFNDIVTEMTQGAASDADNLEIYLKPLYYLSRTFPNMSAFMLTGKDGKFKFTDHVERSPVWEELKSFWKNASAKEKDPAKAVNMIKYALGSICLLPQKEVLASDEEYTFDRSGYATYMQEYIAIYNKYQK